MRHASSLLLLGALSLGCSWSRYETSRPNSPSCCSPAPSKSRTGSVAASPWSHRSGATLLVGARRWFRGAEFSIGAALSGARTLDTATVWGRPTHSATLGVAGGVRNSSARGELALFRGRGWRRAR